MADGKTIASVIRVINVIVGIFLAFIGVWKIVTLTFLANIGSKFFCIFMPIFMIAFGAVIIITEIKKDFGSEQFKFLQTFLGKGVFYLFLSSLSVYQIEDETSDLIGYIYGLILFVFGLMYICFHICKCSGTLHDVRQRYDFYSILFFLGAILFIILAAIVDSGYKYQEWKIDNPDDSKKGLYISAGINFGLFILCLIWKYLKEKQIQRQQQLLGQRGFHQIDDSQDHSSPNLMVTRNQESKESELHSNQGVIN